MLTLPFITILFFAALADSINPSAIAVTFILLIGKERPIPKVISYIAGIFVSYLTIGLLGLASFKYFGSGLNFESVTNTISNPPLWFFYIQLIIGIVLIIYTVCKPQTIDSPQPKKSPVANSLISSFILGITITGVESVTALPYFAALSVIYLANLNTIISFLLLVLYCAIFVLPPIILLFIFLVYRTKFTQVIEWLNKSISPYFNKTMFILSISLGFLLIIDSVIQITNA